MTQESPGCGRKGAGAKSGAVKAVGAALHNKTKQKRAAESSGMAFRMESLPPGVETQLHNTLSRSGPIPRTCHDPTQPQSNPA